MTDETCLIQLWMLGGHFSKNYAKQSQLTNLAPYMSECVVITAVFKLNFSVINCHCIKDCQAQKICKEDAIDCRKWEKLIKDV